MNIIAGVCAPLAVIGVVVLLVLRPWAGRGQKRRQQRGAPPDHARLSRRQRQAWERIKAANVDVAATGAYIAAREERGKMQ